MFPFALSLATCLVLMAPRGEILSPQQKRELLEKLDAPYYYPQQHGLKSLQVKLKSRQLDDIMYAKTPTHFAAPRGKYLWRAPGATRFWLSGVPSHLKEAYREAGQFFRTRLAFIVPTSYSRSLRKLVLCRSSLGPGQVLRCYRDAYAQQPLRTLYIDAGGLVTRMEIHGQRHADIQFTYSDGDVTAAGPPRGRLLKRARYVVKGTQRIIRYEQQFFYQEISGFYLLRRMNTVVLKEDGSADTSMPNPLTMELFEHQVNLSEADPAPTEPASSPDEAPDTVPTP